jgi:hypothetical protein
MINAQVIHEAAMEYYDMANIAKNKGKLNVYQEHLQKAYVLEKEAALTMPEQPHNFMWRYILLRSAGWLAFHCGNFEEANNLAQVGLAGNPPEQERSEFEKLSAAALEKTVPEIAQTVKEDFWKFSGYLASADMLLGQIVVKGNDQFYTFDVSKEEIRALARLYLGDIVQIKASKNQAGGNVLLGIIRAA